MGCDMFFVFQGFPKLLFEQLYKDHWCIMSLDLIEYSGFYGIQWCHLIAQCTTLYSLNLKITQVNLDR